MQVQMPDKMANHFYEQGKADAIRDVVNKSNNTSARQKSSTVDGAMFGGYKGKISFWSGTRQN